MILDPSSYSLCSYDHDPLASVLQMSCVDRISLGELGSRPGMKRFKEARPDGDVSRLVGSRTGRRERLNLLDGLSL
jgi:hypothetical protein